MVINERMHRHGYKWVLCWSALILTVWFGCLNQGYALSFDQINELRVQIGLPALTSNVQIDFQTLSRECDQGYSDSCILAQRLQKRTHVQRVKPIPFDLNNPLGGLNIPPDMRIDSGGGGDHCAECLNYHGDSDVKKAFCSSYLAGRNCR